MELYLDDLYLDELYLDELYLDELYHTDTRKREYPNDTDTKTKKFKISKT